MHGNSCLPQRSCPAELESLLLLASNESSDTVVSGFVGVGKLLLTSAAHFANALSRSTILVPSGSPMRLKESVPCRTHSGASGETSGCVRDAECPASDVFCLA